MKWRLAVFAVLLAWLPVPGLAHAFDPGYLELSALGQDRWHVTWRAPDVNGRRMPIEPELPETCSSDAVPAPIFDGRAWTARWFITCPGGLAGGSIAITGLDRTRTDTLIRYELEPGRTQFHRLSASETAFVIEPNAGMREVMFSYISLGVTHILEGVDHLLFVFALLLLTRDRARLFWAVTAFTAAHSITLAASTLGWLRVPSQPVEALIALSIVFLAFQLTLPPENRDQVAERFPWVVSFAFGLVHGLGFAGALREIGLPEGDIPIALFSFNLGVEIGQLMFVAAVLAIGAIAVMAYPGIRRWAVSLQRVASYLIGSTAAYWVIARVAAF